MAEPPAAAVTPPPIGPSSVATPRAQVAAAVVGSAGLLVDLPTRRSHQVNLTAVAVWASLDGTASVAAIADELAVDFHADPAIIAPDIAAVIATFRDLELVEVDRSPDESTSRISPCLDREPITIGGHRYVRLPPSPCQDGIDALGWDELLAVAVGDHRLGVRTDSPRSTAVLREVLGPHLVDDTRVGPNYSVVLPGTPGESRRAGIHEGSLWLGGAEDLDQVLAMLVARLAAAVPDGRGHLALDVHTLTVGDASVLVPWYRGSTDPRVRDLGDRAGWELAEAPVWVDPATATADMSAPGFAAAHPTALRGIVTPGTATARLEGIDAVAALVPWLAVAPADDGDSLVDRVVELTRHVPVLTAAYDDLPDVAAALIRPR